MRRPPARAFGLLLILLLASFPSAVWAATAFVKAASANSTNAVAFGSAVSAGNLIVGFATYANADTLTSVTDSNGNTYALLTEIDDTVNGQAARGFYAMSIAAGTPTVTANGLTNGATTNIHVHEVSGAATTGALDQQGGAVRTTVLNTTDALTSGAVTTTTDGQYIFCGAVLTSDFASGVNEYTAGTAFTEHSEQNNGASVASATEDRIQAAAGSVNGLWTPIRNSFDHIAIIATFKEAGGAPPPSASQWLLLGVGR